MKLRCVLAVLMAAAVMVWITGCASTAPRPAAQDAKGDLQFTEEVSATVTADQAIVMEGKKFKVADVPKQLDKIQASKHITIMVYPESKMTRETLVELVKTLVQNNYSVAIAADSKYSDVPIPRS